MFTGIIECVGQLMGAVSQTAGIMWEVQTPWFDAVLGESVSIEGACLTVVKSEGSHWFFELSPETLSCTNLGRYTVGAALNLERAVRLGDRLGGHWVLGHVDGILPIAAIEPSWEYIKMVLSDVPQSAWAWCVPKGSITLNGVSLTLNGVHQENIEVLLIPHTQKKTTIGQLGVGSTVNVEYDYVAKIVSHNQQLYGRYE